MPITYILHLIKLISCPMWTRTTLPIPRAHCAAMMTSWFITEATENTSRATERSIAEMNIFHSHYTSSRNNSPSLRRTLKSFPYIRGHWMRNIHKYKCVFYQTNAYQTNVMVCCAHNKEGWLVHFILWALSSTAEIKNIFTAAIHVSLYKPLRTAVKSPGRISVKVGFYSEPPSFCDYTNLAMWKMTEIVLCVA